jgi:hypothetical protein
LKGMVVRSQGRAQIENGGFLDWRILNHTGIGWAFRSIVA